MTTVIPNTILKKEYIVDFISLLFIILFTYAAASKLLEFETFKLQIEQSPILSDFASFLAWGVPMFEILIALMFFSPKLKPAGLWSSFILMALFTGYIYIGLYFSNSIPCSCGGVIVSLSWTQHLFFNIGFTLLAAIGVLLTKNKT